MSYESAVVLEKERNQGCDFPSITGCKGLSQCVASILAAEKARAKNTPATARIVEGDVPLTVEG